MKTNYFLVPFLLFLSSISHAFVTESIPMGCGYSEHIFKQIPLWTQEKSQLNLSYTGKQGETGRRFLMYSDKSWVMTFEFFSQDDVEYDLSCVVQVGQSEEAYEALSSRIPELPSLRFGPSLRAEDEARLKITE